MASASTLLITYYNQTYFLDFVSDMPIQHVPTLNFPQLRIDTFNCPDLSFLANLSEPSKLSQICIILYLTWLAVQIASKRLNL